jgi:MerR family transcriptional regulator, light-induced transcriptional regulator
VNTPIHLIEYPNVPLYNIKAVVQATGVTSSTLRAWERRYQVCQPKRSESGYRLYSERDVATIRWLKSQVEAGMAISQTVSWLETLTGEAKGVENVALPQPNSGAVAQYSTAVVRHLALRDCASLQQELLIALLQYNESRAEEVLTEAFSLYPIEIIGENVIAPMLAEIGERWCQGKISVTVEHYASNYLLQRLAALLRAASNTNKRELIWVGCAPGEQHEIGALLLTLYLRRAGYYTQYVGKDMPAEDLIGEIQRQRPKLVLLSVSLPEVVPELQRLAALLATHDMEPPIIGYGGRAFRQHPELRAGITGIYMGNTAHEAIENIHALLGVNRPAKS